MQVHGYNIVIGKTATDIWMEDIRTLVVEFPYLEPKSIADSIMFRLGTPANVEVGSLSVRC